MREGLQEEALRVMFYDGGVRDMLVSRHNKKWTLAGRLGGARQFLAPSTLAPRSAKYLGQFDCRTAFCLIG